MKLPIIQSKKGFTLIELLIVIAIISILISIGMAAFSRAQKQARDGQRKADLQNIAGAMEQFYSDNNKYPASSSGKISLDQGSPSDCANTGVAIDWGTGKFSCGDPETTYLKQLPKDPTSSKTYSYSVNGTRQIYCLIADLDVNPSTNTTCPVSGSGEFVVSSQD